MENLQQDNAYKQIQKEIRCYHCDRLFTKLTVSWDSDFHKESDVKIAIQTKCFRCKEIDDKLFVV